MELLVPLAVILLGGRRGALSRPVGPARCRRALKRSLSGIWEYLALFYATSMKTFTAGVFHFYANAVAVVRSSASARQQYVVPYVCAVQLCSKSSMDPENFFCKPSFFFCL